MSSLNIETLNDERFKAYVINKMIPFPKMLEQAGFEDYSYEGKCFCPFHDNFESPAAKIYHDKTGDTLWCFSENRRYYPADVLKKGFIKGKSVASIFANLWRKISDDTKELLVDNYDNPISTIPEMWTENQPKLLLFKEGRINISEHIAMMRQCLE